MTESATIDAFAQRYRFPLDDYQIHACRSLLDGAGVLVAAPTGAGKTVVGEFAVHLAATRGGKCFYTTPIKALSNQKYHDLVDQYGPQRVGLLTGDSVVNGEADIVVMTTEVLRNMLYASSPTLTGLVSVVMDEVHYLADPFRGPVWEEVILGLDPSVTLVALSATVSNVEEFGAWLADVRGRIDIIVSETRPVPLYQHIFAGRRLLDLYATPAPGASTTPAVNPELMRLAKEDSRFARDDARRPRGRSGRGKRNHGYGSGAYGGATHKRWSSSPLVPRRSQIVAELERRDLLPAIFFIFSRAGCDRAVDRLVDDGAHLATGAEREALREIGRRAAEGLAPGDLEALRHRRWLEAFERGIAAHHAGLLPAFKQAVEEAFGRGLVKVVFATETLALGINMPARTVVLEKLVKFNGESHADITPGEYTQLTGRAGRRGIDDEGHAVVAWQTGLDPRAVAGLASRRTYPLRSAFTPTYNMAVNLIGALGHDRARGLLERSFAQFHADLAVTNRTGAERGPAHRSRTLVRKFDRICLVLESFGYLEETETGLTVTEPGRRLARVYGVHDLLAAEAVRSGILDDCPPGALAAVLSSLVYEARGGGHREPIRLPDRATERAMEEMRRLWREIRLTERDHRLEQQPPLDIGFTRAAHAWAEGEDLGEILEETDLAAGDFVRWIRQIIDVAGQIADASRGRPLAGRARDLARSMRRGVVDFTDE